MITAYKSKIHTFYSTYFELSGVWMSLDKDACICIFLNFMDKASMTSYKTTN